MQKGWHMDDVICKHKDVGDRAVMAVLEIVESLDCPPDKIGDLLDYISSEIGRAVLAFYKVESD